MSQDFQLAWSCTHEVLEEVALLSSDLKTLQLDSPISNSNVTIYIDGVVVPAGGLRSQGVLYSKVSGPFDLDEDTQSLTVTSSQGTQTVVFNLVGRYSTDSLVKKMGVSLKYVSVENSKGRISITDPYADGGDSFVHVSGSACSALGFVQVRAEGQDIYPSWKIVDKTVKFTAPVKGSHTFQTSYITIPQRCLRCQTTYVENDIRFQSDGSAILVDSEDLLYQSALKMLLTEQGSNPYHSWYGTTIKSRIGAKMVGDVSSILAEEIRTALKKFQNLQSDQARYQSVTPEERLYRIVSVNVKPHDQDLTAFMADIRVQNSSLRPIELNIVFTVPSVVALMGSNGLYLGTETAGVI